MASGKSDNLLFDKFKNINCVKLLIFFERLVK